jgi:hypothetical protein
VPALPVLDNATGAAHRVAWDKAGVAGVSRLFCGHHRVEARFRDPRSGWEKGGVENAVGFLRRNLMVPQPSVEGYRQSARWLPSRCDDLAGRGHCRLGRTVSDLVFCQVDLYGGDCGGNLGPNPSYATRPKSLRYCMGLL